MMHLAVLDPHLALTPYIPAPAGFLTLVEYHVVVTACGRRPVNEDGCGPLGLGVPSSFFSGDTTCGSCRRTRRWRTGRNRG
ncbi:MAG: hypothetical protein OXC95_09505 [Dehalococcoidia bacterium]|nr:hypothetical protein [Dehalococcoidia bacterium]